MSCAFLCDAMARPSPLNRGLRALLTCDSGDVVSGIVSFVTGQSRALRVLSSLMHRGNGSWLTTTVIVLNGFRCFAGVSLVGSGDTVVAARRPNERRAIQHLKRMDPGREFAELAVGWSPGSVIRALAALGHPFAAEWRRTARLARLASRRYGVFRALRVVELLAYYARYSQLLAARPFHLAVMSSHSNPHGIALNLVAHRFGVPIVLITHGMPIVPLARLDYDVAIHECEASRRIYEDAGCRMHYALIKSRRSDHRQLRLPLPVESLTIGMFLSKDPVEAFVVSCLRALLSDAGVKSVVVRPHPVNLWRGLDTFIASLGDSRVAVRSSASLADDLEPCDLVVAGNSTVLLDAVIAGRPGCYVRGLDHGPYDVQHFVGDSLIYEWHPPAALDRSAIARFYAREAWLNVLRLYADVDRADEDLAAEVRAVLRTMSSRAERAILRDVGSENVEVLDATGARSHVVRRIHEVRSRGGTVNG